MAGLRIGNSISVETLLKLPPSVRRDVVDQLKTHAEVLEGLAKRHAMTNMDDMM